MPCTDENFHILVTEYNTHTTQTIRVTRSALGDALLCDDGKMPPGLIICSPRSGGETVEVSRHLLFEFLTMHAASKHAQGWVKQREGEWRHGGARDCI